MTVQPPTCWATEMRRCWTPETFPSSVLRSVGMPVPTACPACMTRARYWAAVSAIPPETPVSGFVHDRLMTLGTDVMSIVTVLAGTDHDPVVLARQNSGSDVPPWPITPPSWTMYWCVPSLTVNPTAMTNPTVPVKTIDTEVFVGGAGAAPGPMYICPSWLSMKSFEANGVSELSSSTRPESHSTRAPTSVLDMSSMRLPGSVAVYPGFVADTLAISSASSVAGGVGVAPARVTTTGMSTILISGDGPRTSHGAGHHGNGLLRHLRDDPRPLVRRDRDPVRGRPAAELGQDQRREVRSELLLGPREVEVGLDLLDDRLHVGDTVLAVERRLVDVEQEDLAEGREHHGIIKTCGVGLHGDPRLRPVWIDDPAICAHEICALRRPWLQLSHRRPAVA